MATYHPTALEAFLAAAREIFQEIAKQGLMRDAHIERWTKRSIGSPVLSLTWSRDYGVKHNVHVGVVDDVNEMVAEIEINSWRDTEQKTKGSDESLFRSIVHKSLPTIRDIDKRDQKQVQEELALALQQAYKATLQVRLEDLPKSSSEDPSHGDPGPIRLERWLGE